MAKEQKEGKRGPAPWEPPDAPNQPEGSGWGVLSRMCEMQMTRDEIAAVFGISNDTLERAIKRKYDLTFGQYFAMRRQAGYASVRRKQYQVAMEGNVTMLIWLGKQWLNQRDKQEVSGPNGGPITFDTVDEATLRMDIARLEQELAEYSGRGSEGAGPSEEDSADPEAASGEEAAPATGATENAPD